MIESETVTVKGVKTIVCLGIEVVYKVGDYLLKLETKRR